MVTRNIIVTVFIPYSTIANHFSKCNISSGEAECRENCIIMIDSLEEKWLKWNSVLLILSLLSINSTYYLLHFVYSCIDILPQDNFLLTTIYI